MNAITWQEAAFNCLESRSKCTSAPAISFCRYKRAYGAEALTRQSTTSSLRPPSDLCWFCRRCRPPPASCRFFGCTLRTSPTAQRLPSGSFPRYSRSASSPSGLRMSSVIDFRIFFYRMKMTYFISSLELPEVPYPRATSCSQCNVILCITPTYGLY